MLDTTPLKALSLAELDKITGLATTGAQQWEAIVDTIRDQIYLSHDRMIRADGTIDHAIVHEVADYLVPPTKRLRASEYAVIGAAWDVNPDDFAALAGPHELWTTVQPSDDARGADVCIGRALYVSYRHALTALAEWTWEQQTAPTRYQPVFEVRSTGP